MLESQPRTATPQGAHSTDARTAHVTQQRVCGARNAYFSQSPFGSGELVAAEAISQHCMLPACHAPLGQEYRIAQQG
jgi:hypothetical protein